MRSLIFFVYVSLVCVSARQVAKDFSRRSHRHEKAQGCVLLSNEYQPSKLEQLWSENAHKWSNNFCSRMDAFSRETDIWLDTIASLEQGKVSTPMDDAVFSSFISTHDCNGDIVKKKTWIEPLSHGLRHPRALCGGGAGLVDRDYLLLANRNDFLNPATSRHELRGGCAKRSCQNIYIDLGASTWNSGLGGPSQSWFYTIYDRHGLDFDRLLLWEARPTPAEEIFSGLPQHLWHKYQYFNWPASSNSSDPSSPLNILKKIAQTGDFVVLKLDIDTPEVEMVILRELMNDPDLLELVDEFFFEYHVLFKPMNMDWFGSENPSPRPTSDTLADSYKVFRTLREKGVRAHSWV